MKTLLAGIVAGGIFLLASPLSDVNPDVKPGYPEGSCCVVKGNEGSSHWNPACTAGPACSHGHWSCKLNSATIKPAPKTPEERDALRQDQLKRAGDPGLDSTGTPIGDVSNPKGQSLSRGRR